MNLTIALRNELMMSVLRDQMLSEFKKLEGKFKQEANRLADKENDGLYVITSKVISDAGKDPSNFLHCKRTGSLNSASKFLVTHKTGSTKHYMFNLNTEVPIDNPHLTASYWSGSVELKPDAKAKSLLAQITEFYLNARELRDNLNAVLNSVKTVKKLQELTSVFNPFIPTNSACTALLPAEAILKINELKSPKTKVKKAA